MATSIGRASASPRLAYDTAIAMARDEVFLLVTISGRSTVEVTLGSEPLLIGREESCGVPVDRPYVSRRHAEIRPRGKGYELVDLGARNPITVNGLALSERRPLVSGDLVRLGPDAFVEFWDHRKDVATTAMLDSSQPRSSAAEARALRETRRPGAERGTPPVLLVTTLHNARQIAAVEAAASHVFGVHRGILGEVLGEVGAQPWIVDDGCTAELDDAATAVSCALAIVSWVARYNHEHPSLPLRLSAAVASAAAGVGVEPVLPSRLLLAATELLRRAMPQEVLVTEGVARALAGSAAVETRERGLFALGGEAPRPLFAVVARRAGPTALEPGVIRLEPLG